MLFMTIGTWDPEKRAEIIQRYIDRGEPVVPEGAKLIGWWTDLSGGRSFNLSEVDDPNIILETAMGWNDILKLEIIPVMDAQEIMKIIQA